MINKVLTYQRRLLRGWQSFANGHQKHRHREKGRDAEGDFLPGLGGHVEHQQGWRANRSSVRESFILTAKYWIRGIPQDFDSKSCNKLESL